MQVLFNTALSALRANGSAIDVTGHNLANLNTAGYKVSTVSFEEMVSEKIRSNDAAPNGAGVGPINTSKQFNQGSVQTTGGQFDAAISGNGFFVVKDSADNTLYTRAGNFRLSADGKLLTASGEAVQGYMATKGVVTPGGVPTDIVVPPLASNPPTTSTFFGLNVNLNALTDETNTAKNSFSAPVEVVDALGSKHTLTVKFTKTGVNAWDYEVTMRGDEVTGGDAETPASLATGSLAFDSKGVLTTPAVADGDVEIKLVNLANGAEDLTVNWQTYNSDGQPRLTQYSDPSAVASTDGDGTTAAQLSRISLGDGGKLIASYSNGTQQVLAILALATVNNPDTLAAMGNNNYATTPQTGAVTYGDPGTGSRGSVSAGALEGSNVDMARELTNVILFQRSYQANARVITTAQELSQEVINLKR